MAQRPETKAIRIQTQKTNQKEHATPLFLTSSFTYSSAEEMASAFADDSLDINNYSENQHRTGVAALDTASPVFLFDTILEEGKNIF